MKGIRNLAIDMLDRHSYLLAVVSIFIAVRNFMRLMHTFSGNQRNDSTPECTAAEDNFNLDGWIAS